MGLLSSGKLILGYLLDDKNSQISIAVSDKVDPVTLSTSANAQNYNIPTVLCKRSGTDQWAFGQDAIKMHREGNGQLVEHLVDRARSGEPVVVDGETFHPVALLALFVKRSLGLLQTHATTDKISAMMITCPVIDKKWKEIVGQIVQGLKWKPDMVFLQSHPESFFHFMIQQPMELWSQQVVLFHYEEERIKVYSLECNRRAVPNVAYVTERDFPLWSSVLSDEKRDLAFLNIAKEVCGEQLISSVYLIGDGFAGEWLKESLRFLCRGRRVFQGNNLFSKGACFGLRERMFPTQISKEYVFLGEDKLKTNVGLKLLRQSEYIYQPLLDAGVNWYEAEGLTEFYIQDGNRIQLELTPLARGVKRSEEVVLAGLPEALTRVQIHLFMEEENSLAVEVTDLGLGNLRASSGLTWKHKIEL